MRKLLAVVFLVFCSAVTVSAESISSSDLYQKAEQMLGNNDTIVRATDTEAVMITRSGRQIATLFLTTSKEVITKDQAPIIAQSAVMSRSSGDYETRENTEDGQLAGPEKRAELNQLFEKTSQLPDVSNFTNLPVLIARFLAQQGIEIDMAALRREAIEDYNREQQWYRFPRLPLFRPYFYPSIHIRR